MVNNSNFFKYVLKDVKIFFEHKKTTFHECNPKKTFYDTFTSYDFLKRKIKICNFGWYFFHLLIISTI